VTIYLRAPLFVPEKGSSAPKHAMVLGGTLVESGLAGGLTIQVSRWADQRGRPLDSEDATLFLPMAKIDHAVSEG
jgi:hypothetical protein